MKNRVIWTIPRFLEAKTGGIRYHSEVLAWLREADWDVLACSMPVAAGPSRLRRNLLSNLTLARAVLSEARPRDIVVEVSDHHAKLLLANALLRLRGVRTVAICHHLSHHDLVPDGRFRVRAFKAADRFIEALFFRTADRVIAVSSTTRDEILALGISPRKVAIVPNGVDRPPPVVAPARDARPRALFVGSVCRRKGLTHLVAAAALLKDTGVVVDCVGPPDDEEYLRRLQDQVSSSGLEHSVRFHGLVSREQLWEFYARADIFVLPSLWEGWGVVLMEAMSFSIPIVVSRAGATTELVADGENGLIVPPGDTAALADAIRKLVGDPGLRKRLGRNGKMRFRQSPTWEQVGQRFGQALSQLEM